MDLTGVYPPMVTPTRDETGGVDVDVLETYTDYLLDGGVHGLFPCGSIGEFASLTREERRTVVETVADRADVPVLAGCGATALDDVVAHATDAAAAGADAAVVVTPYYLSAGPSGLEAFFRAVADAAPLPVVLYHIPRLTGRTLPAATVASLADHPNVVGIKDSSGDMGYHARLLDATPEGFAVAQGSSPLALASLDAGADVVVSGASDVFPAAVVALYEAVRDGDHARALRIQTDVVTPLMDAVSDLPTAVGIKTYLRLAGFDVGPPVVPLARESEATATRLRERYEAVASALGDAR